MMASVTPVATPLPQEPEPDAKTPPTAAAPGLPAAPGRKPDHVADRTEGAGDGAARRNTGAKHPGGLVVTRVLVKASRSMRRPDAPTTSPAAPRHRHGDPRAAPRSGQPPEPAVAGGGGTSTPAAARCAEAERAASTPRSAAAATADQRRLGLVRAAAALRNTAAAAAARLLRRVVRRRALVAFSSPAAHRR